MKFGRIKPLVRRRHFQLANYLRAGLPTAPSAVDYSTPSSVAPVLADVMLNDQLGNCGIAGGYHIVGVETGNAGSAFHATSAEITADYSAIGGYVPGDPSTDQGIVLSDALTYWQTHGFANGTKLLGSLEVNATNQAQAMAALWLFENLYLGLELPDTYTNPFPSGNGFTWGPGTPDPSQGHCIIAYGYTPTGLLIDSWGLKGTLEWNAFEVLCAASAGGEAYVLLTPDQLAKGASKAPNNVAWSDIIADFDSLGGTVPIPAPTAPPAPAPGPNGEVALAQAQAWSATGINKAFPLMTRAQAVAAANAGLAAEWPKS
jgi:hypothetical protein